ncbi:hypothetical protein Tco_1058732 [Tanacetum coccineum]|uniref:Uncharacterized protein n=1 Tax=Tanacetum coccineum TaxID=301880 RepID=A0ABQ5HAN9_9ASTR
MDPRRPAQWETVGVLGEKWGQRGRERSTGGWGTGRSGGTGQGGLRRKERNKGGEGGAGRGTEYRRGAAWGEKKDGKRWKW